MSGTRAWVETMARRRKQLRDRARYDAARGRRCQGPTNGKRPCGVPIAATNASGYCTVCANRERSRAAALARDAARSA